MAWAGIVILALTLGTPAGRLLESAMASHVMIELPLLALAGYLIAHPFRERWSKILSVFNRGGVPGILIASFALAFWMIPKWLDYSLVDAGVAWLKYVSLTFLVGFPLALSWPALHPVVAALLKIEFLVMLARLGWIYLISPNRLCNSYLLDDQILLGQGLLAVAATLCLIWTLPLFVDSRSPGRPHARGGLARADS